MSGEAGLVLIHLPILGLAIRKASWILLAQVYIPVEIPNTSQGKICGVYYIFLRKKRMNTAIHTGPVHLGHPAEYL